MAPVSPGQLCRTANRTNSRRSLRRDVGPQQLEARRALVLTDRQSAGVAELRLAGFAQKPGLEHGAHIALHELGAAPVDVEGTDRALARRRRGIDATPTVVAVPRLEEVGQRVGLLAFLWARLRVGHNTQPRERAARIEQTRYDHREIQDLGASILGDRCPRAVRSRPIFELVVVAEINFAQTVRLGLASLILGPAGESLLRRSAIAAAGIVDERVAGQSRCRGPEFQRPYIGTRRRIIGARDPDAEDE